MAGYDNSTLNGLILNVYSKDSIQRLQNLESPLLGMLKPRPYVIGGSGFIFGVNVSGNEGMGFRADTDSLPAAQRERVEQATVSPRPYFATVQVTGLSQEVATGQPASFANLISYALDEQLSRAAQYREGALFRTNQDILALVNESPSGTTLTVDGPGALWFRQGMVIDFFSSAAAYKTTATVTDVDWVNNSITTAADISSLLADNDQIHLQGTQSTTSGSFAARSFDGLEAATSASGTYLNISRKQHCAFAQ